ncbi:MAG TPA: hypothetical protein VHT51_02300 [Micropepsaceae bacterium]|jgi:hypothetical protein|nr:hypothetical protein [Micropepsaceae bacterium]
MRLFHQTFAGFALLLATAAAAQPMADLSGRDPHWIRDPAKDCWAANPTPEQGETVTWTGECEGGLLNGQGTLTWYVNGKPFGRDEGNFKAGQLAGHGRIIFADGANFEGEFPGHGILTLPSGRTVEAVSINESSGWSIEQAANSPAP